MVRSQYRPDGVDVDRFSRINEDDKNLVWTEHITPEHINLEIRQIYVWVISSNQMVAIVTKEDGKSQFPGGHPEQGENNVETVI